MTISEISGGPSPLDPVKGKKNKDAAKTKILSRDKVQLSEEARSLFEADHEKRLQIVREKIQQGFYFQRGVTEKVVDLMLKDLAEPNQ
jgi:anti-sigma28 factor (negative regulator of flagellin synthesis)